MNGRLGPSYRVDAQHKVRLEEFLLPWDGGKIGGEGITPSPELYRPAIFTPELVVGSRVWFTFPLLFSGWWFVKELVLKLVSKWP
jgi:hypothetical protein